jgi:hypothetical protein
MAKSGRAFFPPKDEEQQAARWELAGRPSGLAPLKTIGGELTRTRMKNKPRYKRTPKEGPIPPQKFNKGGKVKGQMRNYCK